VDERTLDAGLDHPGGHSLCDEEGGTHIQVHQVIEVLDLERDEGLRTIDASIVEQHMEGRPGLYGSAYRIQIRDIECQRLG
jgi:hypothetical protein